MIDIPIMVTYAFLMFYVNLAFYDTMKKPNKSLSAEEFFFDREGRMIVINISIVIILALGHFVSSTI